MKTSENVVRITNSMENSEFRDLDDLNNTNICFSIWPLSGRSNRFIRLRDLRLEFRIS